MYEQQYFDLVEIAAYRARDSLSKEGASAMKDPFSEFQKERERKTIQSVIDAMEMIGKGIPDEKVREVTGLNMEDIQKIKRILKEKGALKFEGKK